MKAAKDVRVSDYIAKAPSWAKPVLREMRAAIKNAAPEATESISYHMPYYSQNGRLAYISYFKEHCSFFWIGRADKKLYAKQLAKLPVKGSTLRIPQGSKVPVALIKKIVRARAKSNEARKKSKK